jgi:hypothetical protein
MEVVAVANDAGKAALADKSENFDLNFLPKSLTAQCQSLIESYHELHGYACLPNMLWKARLGRFIQAHRELRQLLRKASTTRSAKKANEGFVRIATTILSLEILASSFAGWSAIYPARDTTSTSSISDGRQHRFYINPDGCARWPRHGSVSETALCTCGPEK